MSDTSTVPEATALPAPQPPRRSRRPLIMGILIVVVALVGSVSAYLILSGEPSPSGLRATERSFDSIAITWRWEGDTSPPGFIVSRDGIEIAEVSGTERGYLDPGLEPSTDYRYSVAAELEDGPGAPSPEVVAATSAIPVPADLRGTDVGFESAAITWSWPNEVLPDGFLVYRDGVEVARTVDVEHGYNDAELEPGTSYGYTVAAEYGGVVGEPTPTLAVRTPRLPPLSQAKLSGTHRVVVRWTDQSGFESIRVGSRDSATWTFTPQRRGARLDAFLPAGGSWSMRLQGKGATYRGTARSSLSNCAGVLVQDTIEVTVRLRTAEVRFDEWVATRWTGHLDVQSPSASSGFLFCAAGSFGADLEGRAMR